MTLPAGTRVRHIETGRKGEIDARQYLGSIVVRADESFEGVNGMYCDAFIAREDQLEVIERGETFRCVYPQCEATFVHPDGECGPSVDGMCCELMQAGWKPALVRVYEQVKDAKGRYRERGVCFSGGWLCPKGH